MSDLFAPMTPLMVPAKPKPAVPEMSLDEAFPLNEMSIDEAFPQPREVTGSFPLADYFVRGWKLGFGDKPFQLTEAWAKLLQDSGLIGDIEKKQQSILQEFNETLLLGPAAVVDRTVRSFLGGVYGVSQTMVESGVPRDLTPGAALEAFPAGRLTGLPARIRPVRPPLDLDMAAELGWLDSPSPDVIARRAFAPDPQVIVVAPETLPEARPAVEPAVPVAAPTDVHVLARELAPDAYRRFDDLAEKKAVLTEQLGELAEQRNSVIQKEIDTILGKVRGVEARLTNRARERLETLREDMEFTRGVDTPEMAAVRKARQEIDFEMRDLAPEVSEALREARRLMPEEPLTAVPEAVPDNVVPFVAPEAVPEAVAEPAIRSLAQRRPSIRQDAEAKLINAGRPADEARASAALIEAHYEARAARFNGALGTARDLYEAETPRVVGARGQQRGRTLLRNPRNTIQLFERADASTFMHETAHNWLEELRRDYSHERAPADLKADFDAVREWVGADGSTFTRAQHEKFARGFERYLMEGQAPTSRLAKVFEQFKNWLTQIYQTVARLRSPITDDIRGVYDRLISAPRQEPVIVPERPGALSFAEEHRVAARETPIADAAAKADEMRAVRDRVAAMVREEVDRARREARRGPERIEVPRRDGEGGGTERARASTASADDPLGEGRTPASGKTEPPRSSAEVLEPADGPLVDKAGNIRIENLNVPEDVGEAIREAAGLKGGFLNARRGVMSDAEVSLLAEDLGMAARSLDRRKIGEAFNAEQIVAARRLLVRSATEVRDAAAKAADGGIKEVIDYAVARERHILIQEQVAGITAEAGRALRAFRDLKGADAELIADLFQRTLDRTPEALQREAKLLTKLDTPAKVSKRVRRFKEPTWMDMAVEAWINGLLSGPMTHIVNVGSNFSVAGLNIAETAVASGIGRVTGSRAVQFAEVGDRFAGLLDGAVDGLKAAGAVILDESKIPRARTIDLKHMQAIPSVNVGGIRVGGANVRLPGRLLAAEDEFFKAIAFNQELRVLARRAAREEGLTGDAFLARIDELFSNPTDSMVAAAQQFSEYQTFTNMLGPTGRSIQAFANSHPAFRFVLPFIRTPVNIFKYSTERTLIGLAFREVRDNLAGHNGAVARDTQRARMALGNAVALGVGYLTLNDLISDGGPVRQEEIETLRNTGWQPYSIRLGDTWYSYRRFDPLGNIIGLAADFTAIGQYVAENDDEYEKLGSMVALSIYRNLFDKLSLRGVSGLVQAVTNYERYGQSFLNSFLASAIPAASGQIARMDDPVMREARDLADTLKSRILWERKSLFPRRDRWGDPIAETELGPIYTRQVNNDPVNAAMLDLDINKAAPQRKIEGVELTKEQYDDYARISGRLAKQMLDAIVTAEFRQIPKFVQIKGINDTIDKAREAGQAEVMHKYLGTPDDILQKKFDLLQEQMR